MVEGVDVGVMGNQVEDVDEVEGCGVEEVTVDSQAGDVGCYGFEGSHAVVCGIVHCGKRELLKREHK